MLKKLLGQLFGDENNNELQSILSQSPFLVDVRSASEFQSGSVKGAVNIPLGEIERELKKFNGKEQIVVFCRSGARSGQAKSILEKNGFSNVTNGGGWQTVNQLINK